MKLTILQTGAIPAPLDTRFPAYPDMFRAMFREAGAGFSYEVVPVLAGAPLPDPAGLDGVLITGSPAGVYDDFPWIDPLRAFIRDAYAQRTRMVGICFGHQIIADALGGDVRKSEKGWGLGRHVYGVSEAGAALGLSSAALAVACSHQDQVISAPLSARVVLGSEFTPNAGLVYDNGAVLTFQPHPEFADDYTLALAELRRGAVPDAVVDAAVGSLATPSDSAALARAITGFLAD